MEKSSRTIQEAESFVRQALSHFSDARADEKAIKSAALKVSKALPPTRKKEHVAA
jgi:hypothetical protein